MARRLRTTSIAAGGDAVARDDDGKVVFVAGALPGEVVDVEITTDKKDFRRAHVLDVVEPAAGRVAPPCPHIARGCGGCAWQGFDVVIQRALKREIVADALGRIGHIDSPHVDDGPDLTNTAFRTTVRLAAGRGFRAARSHDVVDIDECLVAHPLIQDLMRELVVDDATEVTLRCGTRTGERLVVTDGTVVHVPADVRVGPKAHLHEEVAGRTWCISAHSFFQARPDGADALVDAVQRAASDAPPDGPLVDAYGGVGLFAGTVGVDRETTVVEWNRSSVADARHNVPDATVLRLDVARWRPSAADVVVADPARAGLGRDAAARLAGTGASHLVLVSCDPAALGRDARLLAEHGFTHDGTTVVDLFPHTPHVECVTRFIR